MLFFDRKYQNDKDLYLTEYMASFWNAEAVRKVRETRERASQHNFANDKEFEEQVISGTFKDNPLIKALEKIRKEENANNGNLIRGNGRLGKIKSPTNLTSLTCFNKD